METRENKRKTTVLEFYPIGKINYFIKNFQESQMVTKSEAIKSFLNNKTWTDLANLYNLNMECQVNVAPDKGERVQDTYEGIQWVGYTDGITTWKNFRIPYKAFDEPEYTDTIIKYDLGEHVEAIGMTGWDWVEKKSKWVAFDFDHIIGHKSSNALTTEDLELITEKACSVPWITARRSTGGAGVHLYVFIKDSPVTNNHNEHAALARSILSKLSSLTGFDFNSKVDICGGNMWVWHRKMTQENKGLELLKQGVALDKIPDNWRDHLEAIQKRTVSKSSLNLKGLREEKIQYRLTSKHIELINFLEENATKSYWWDFDRNMLVCHTLDLKNAHQGVGLYDTNSSGTSSHNCFCFPRKDGSWIVRRYSLGVKEHPYWDTDAAGWTTILYNALPSFRTACRVFKGLEDDKGIFNFPNGKNVQQMLDVLKIKYKVPEPLYFRKCTVRPHKDGRLILECPFHEGDSKEHFEDWLHNTKRKEWQIIISADVNRDNKEAITESDDIRHLLSIKHEDGGWVINVNAKWNSEPLTHVKSVLRSKGYSPNDIEYCVGTNIMKPWIIVNKPFQKEYLGDREWNRYATQFRFSPSDKDVLNFPTWMRVFNHVGKSIDSYVKNNEWCRNAGIYTGGEYLKYWTSSMIQYPEEHLPYLFIYAEAQETGKSMFHEALSLLFKPGVIRADNALINKTGFNGELEGAILCVVEETDISENRTAYNRIKDWVTSKTISIHPKGKTPYDIQNITHWVQCANKSTNCPIFDGDTRITVLHVPEKPETLISKTQLISDLEREAPDFLRELINLTLPKVTSRLRIPVIDSDIKVLASRKNMSALELFINTECFYVPGELITLSSFYEQFTNWLDPTERLDWSKNKVSKHMPEKYPKGRDTKTANWCYGNLSFKDIESDKPKLIVVGECLHPSFEC